jgi:hypothetical protein
MKRTAVIALGVASLSLPACSDHVPEPAYTQSRAINQDIEATHVVGPTTSSPGFTHKIPSPPRRPTIWAGSRPANCRDSGGGPKRQRASSSLSQ